VDVVVPARDQDFNDTLVATVVLAAVASVLLIGSIHTRKRIAFIPERIIASVKETFEWMTQYTT